MSPFHSRQLSSDLCVTPRKEALPTRFYKEKNALSTKMGLNQTSGYKGWLGGPGRTREPGDSSTPLEGIYYAGLNPHVFTEIWGQRLAGGSMFFLHVAKNRVDREQKGWCHRMYRWDSCEQLTWSFLKPSSHSDSWSPGTWGWGHPTHLRATYVN